MKRLFCLSAVIVMTGCVISGPPTDQAIQDIKVEIKGEAFCMESGQSRTVPYDVVSVSKLDGVQATDGVYKFEVEYTLKFKANSNDIEEDLIFPKDKTTDAVAGVQLSNYIHNRFGDFKKGELKDYTKWFKYCVFRRLRPGELM